MIHCCCMFWGTSLIQLKCNLSLPLPYIYTNGTLFRNSSLSWGASTLWVIIMGIFMYFLCNLNSVSVTAINLDGKHAKESFFMLGCYLPAISWWSKMIYWENFKRFQHDHVKHFSDKRDSTSACITSTPTVCSWLFFRMICLFLFLFLSIKFCHVSVLHLNASRLVYKH